MAFQISQETDKDFSQAAIDLSFEILRTGTIKTLLHHIIPIEPKQLAGITDIKTSLRERSTLLKELLGCLQLNDVLDRVRLRRDSRSHSHLQVNPNSRFVLMSNAEKMEAALELWQYHTSLLGRQVHDKSAHHLKLLEEAIEQYLAKHGEAIHGYSALRTFFRSHVRSMAGDVGFDIRRLKISAI